MEPSFPVLAAFLTDKLNALSISPLVSTTANDSDLSVQAFSVSMVIRKLPHPA